MSVPAIALTAIQGLGMVALQALFGTSAFRAIGPLTADVTVEEEHHDEMFITQHPVEQGAAISDHAFKQPARVHIRVGWSPAGEFSTGNSLLDSALAIIPNAPDPSYLTDIYANLLLLQDSASLLSVFTGKRAYANMLIRSLSVKTDQQTENALFVDVDLQQVIIVQTQTVSMPPNANQAQPQITGTTQQRGTQQLQAVG